MTTLDALRIAGPTEDESDKFRDALASGHAPGMLPRATRGTQNAYLDRGALTEGSRLAFVASTAGVKRDGLDLKLDGLETANFEANPVFLWAHDYSGRTLPIGRVTKLRKLKSRLDIDVEFDQDDPFAVEVERKYRDGYLSAVSIGWNALEYGRGPEPVDGSEAVFEITRSELLDISAVPVPGDPEALLKAARTFLGEDLAKLDEILGTDEPDVDGERQRSVDADGEPATPDLTYQADPEALLAMQGSLQTAIGQIEQMLAAQVKAPEPVSDEEPHGEVADVVSLEALRDALDTGDSE